MNSDFRTKPLNPDLSVELTLSELSQVDLNDLCDATDSAIESGGGFGWVDLPAREILERFWQGVITMPNRLLFIARLDGVICGTAQLICPSKNNEAQSFSCNLTTHFIAPWARGYGLANKILREVEQAAREREFEIINLDVRETQKAAISLYESHGYKVFGTHPHYAKVNGAIIQGIYYYKDLSDSGV